MEKFPRNIPFEAWQYWKVPQKYSFQDMKEPESFLEKFFENMKVPENFREIKDMK